jgi:WD40 repeat protein/transcriptional regulator with XRE-family HTH domain/DNA-binding transcriptional regulator GbsR (MarR family)
MKSFYGERDYTFGQTMLSLRTSIGLTQAGLADLLGISRRTVGEWEAGSSYPTAEHLKQLIELGVRQQAFPTGSEGEAIRALWQTAHQKILLDEQWLSSLLSRQHSQHLHTARLPIETIRPGEPTGARTAAPETVAGPRVDWGDALEVPTFYGREEELALLTQWIVQERCRVVSVLGMGGIGKSALAVKLMHSLAGHFEIVIFRSLRDAPSCEELLDDCIQVLSPQPQPAVPATLERRISQLLEYLRTYRTLLVLDNLENLLEEGDSKGRLRSGFEGYGRLLQQVAGTAHRSCLLLTSREKAAELRPLEGRKNAPARFLRLPGLDTTACQHLFIEKEVIGTEQEQVHLAEAYAGNPLVLKIVAETIRDLFGGEIRLFLAAGTMIFGNIADLLSEQFARLANLEQIVLCWLAIMREPVTLDELQTALVVPLSRVQVLDAVDGLRRRSLIERGQRQGSFTLQSVVLEYVTTLLIEEATRELQQRQLNRLIQHGLEQANAREYVRQAQERLLLAPILAHLQNVYQEQSEVEQLLCSLLDQLRDWTDYAQGYGPANLAALLRLLRGHLRGIDLSRLVIRRAYLQGIEMQDASLAGATMRDNVFTEVMNVPWSVTISSSGEYWGAGSMQGEVHIWRQGLQMLHLTWPAHTNTIITMAFSPDERTLATGSWDGSVKLWDVASGALRWIGSRHTKGLNCVAFAPDGNILVSSASDATVRFWDPQSGTNLQTLLHPHPMYAIVWSPDGHTLATGDFAGQIRLWHIQPDQPATCIETFSGHSNWVTGLAFAPDGKTLASASVDRTVKLWEIESRHLLQTLTGHKDQVHRVIWSPDGRTVASSGYDQTIWLWDCQRDSYRAALRGHDAAVYGIAFTPDSHRLLSGSEDGTLRVWDVASGQCLHILRGYAISYYDIAWSSDGTQLVSGSTDGLVVTWDVTTGIAGRILRGHHKLVFGVAWSPDDRLVASSGWDNTIRIWDPASGACLQILRDPDDPDTTFLGVAWSSDGQRLACSTDKRGVQVWNVTKHCRQWGGYTHPMWIDDVAWSPDGTLLASTSDDGSVYLWDARAGIQLQRWPGHHGVGRGVAWSPDGSRLASCGGEEGKGELFIWNVQNGEQVQAFAGHPGIVYTINWSPCGDQLISGGSDGILRWWDVQSGQCIKTRIAHQGTIQALRVDPTGRRLASCSDDGAIKIWDLHSTEHLQTLRRDRPYERLDITGIKGLSEARKATLRVLGAIEENTSL